MGSQVVHRHAKEHLGWRPKAHAADVLCTRGSSVDDEDEPKLAFVPSTISETIRAIHCGTSVDSRMIPTRAGRRSSRWVPFEPRSAVIGADLPLLPACIRSACQRRRSQTRRGLRRRRCRTRGFGTSRRGDKPPVCVLGSVPGGSPCVGRQAKPTARTRLARSGARQHDQASL
jgi:hypothetical protein